MIPGGSKLLCDYWTPSRISTALWVDFSDRSTVTVVSGAASSITDKSGNGNTVSQGTAGNRPEYGTAFVNGLQVAGFNGATMFMSAADSASLQLGTGQFTLAALVVYYNVNRGSTFQNTVVSKNYTGLEIGNYQSNTFSYFSGATPTGNLSLAINTPYVQVMARNSSNVCVQSRDGTEGTTGSNSGSISQSGTVFNLGFRPGGTASMYLYGQIGEVVFCADGSTATRQKIEGYLAWKWGRQSSLASGHPYKNTPPI